MSDLLRPLSVLADGEPFASGCRFRLAGKARTGLFPSLFLLQCRDLKDPDFLRLSRTRELAVLRGDSCLAAGVVSDVYRQTVPEGTLTTAAFSLGLDLWEAQVSVSVEAGVSLSETVRRLLLASGTGVRLLSLPGADPVRSRGQAFFGRAAECVSSALSAASARGYLVPAGLCVIPKDPLPPSLHLSGKDLSDVPAFVDGGKKMILSTSVTGFQPGEEMTLEWEGRTLRGLILERGVDADNVSGPWKTELLVEVRNGTSGI